MNEHVQVKNLRWIKQKFKSKEFDEIKHHKNFAANKINVNTKTAFEIHCVNYSVKVTYKWGELKNASCARYEIQSPNNGRVMLPRKNNTTAWYDREHAKEYISR